MDLFSNIQIRIHRSINEPVRENLSFEESWRKDDKGLIKCWETGRKLAIENPELAEKAIKDQLPVLGWKGGSDKAVQKKEKYGSLNYLAQWQGLRGEDLDIDMSRDTVLTCSYTGMKTTFTSNIDFLK